MQTYFPYSQIISSICTNIKQTISRHTYTSAWQVIDNKSDKSNQASLLSISEIYY